MIGHSEFANYKSTELLPSSTQDFTYQCTLKQKIMEKTWTDCIPRLLPVREHLHKALAATQPVDFCPALIAHRDGTYPKCLWRESTSTCSGARPESISSHYPNPFLLCWVPSGEPTAQRSKKQTHKSPSALNQHWQCQR